MFFNRIPLTQVISLKPYIVPNRLLIIKVTNVDKSCYKNCEISEF